MRRIILSTVLCVAVTLGCDTGTDSSISASDTASLENDSNSETTPAPSGQDEGNVSTAQEEEAAVDPEVEEETSWQQDPEYPFPSEEMMEIWGKPYTYPEQECVEIPEGVDVPEDAITVNEDGEDTLCFWQNAQGCVPAGVEFTEVTSCDVAMTTSARFFKFPGYKFESDITLMDQPEYEAEADWAKSQIRSCGCLCCHDAEQGAEDGFATAFDIAAKGIWTDTMTDFGLLTAAGIIDTELLGGTFDPATNHGFNRVASIFPSDDEDRMTEFFLGEVERRGLSNEEIQALIDSVPNRFAGLYMNYSEETEPCEPGYGVDPDGKVHWASNGRARYVYILEEGSKNVADPPGLDSPDGILWRMDTPQAVEPSESGAITYGVDAEGAFTRVPETGDAPELVEGTTYKLFVLRDFGPLRLANCTFVFGDPVVTEE